MVTEQEKYRLLIENMPDAFAYHRVINDKNKKPVDYVFLDVNPAFEEIETKNLSQ